MINSHIIQRRFKTKLSTQSKFKHNGVSRVKIEGVALALIVSASIHSLSYPILTRDVDPSGLRLVENFLGIKVAGECDQVVVESK